MNIIYDQGDTQKPAGWVMPELRCGWWGQSPEVLSEMAPVSAFLVLGITWASGKRWSGARRAPWGSWTRQRPRSPQRSCPWRPMTDGPQRAIPPGDAHPASLTFLPFIFGGNLHLITGMQTFKKDHQVNRSSRWLPAASSTVISQAWRRASQRRLLTCDLAFSDGLLGGGLNGDGRLAGGTLPTVSFWWGLKRRSDDSVLWLPHLCRFHVVGYK